MHLAVAKKCIQLDTPAPLNRIAASHFVPLGWWGVVNTRKLAEMNENIKKIGGRQFENIQIAI
jgi:hypothetical protein